LRDGEATTYKIYASFDKNGKKLQLNLFSNTVERNARGEVLDGGEYSEIYFFGVSAGGKIKFIQVRLAG